MTKEQITLEDLEQYQHLRAEIKKLHAEIVILNAKPLPIVTDSVRGSTPEYPYTGHMVMLRGESKRAQDIRAKRNQKYWERVLKNEEDLLKIEEWLNELEDAKLRRLIREHYIQGNSWRVAAARVYGSPNFEDAAKKYVSRFFLKCHECPDSP